MFKQLSQEQITRKAELEARVYAPAWQIVHFEYLKRLQEALDPQK